MDHAKLREAVMGYFRAELQAAKDRRNGLGPFSDDEKGHSQAALGLLEQGNAVYWKTMGSQFARRELDRLFRASGLLRSEYADHTPQVLDEIRRGRIGAHKAVMAHGEGLEAYDFSEARSGAVSVPVASDDVASGSTLREAVAVFFDEQEKIAAWSSGTFQKRRAALAVALEWFGPETCIETITKREAAEFKSALLSLPANRAKIARLKGLSLREAVAVEGVPTISGATVDSYLSAYKVFWQWAEAHGYATEVLFEGMKVGKKAGTAKARKPFTQEALGKTYAALTDPDSPYYQKTSHRWATLIAMFSGARQNEVCQLEVGDIVQDNGIWVFRFDDEGDSNKRLKSAAARRRVPIHSHLIELGLLDLREQRAAHGQRLFSDYEYHEKHGYGGKLSKWFNRTLTQKLGIKSDAHVFHGLRHTFATRLGQADVPTERIQFIIGHERQGVTHQVYMKEGYTLQQTREAVERFSVYRPS